MLIVGPDERPIAEMEAALRREYGTVRARTGDEAIRRLAICAPSAAVVAFSLPDMPGLEVCRHLRKRDAPTIIFMTGIDSEANALACYAAGADGYLTRPRPRELEARIRAALRRAPIALESMSWSIVVGDVSLNLDRHELRVREQVVRIPLREFSVLSVLLATPGKVWTREALMRRIWGEVPASGTKSLDVHVRRIRGRIEDDPSRPTRIVTVRGVGYRYAAPVETKPSASLS